MKNKTFLMIMLMLPTFSFVNAQNSGVYISADDFKNGTLTYGIDCAKEKHKIKLNEFLNKPYITVIHDGKSHKLQKNEIFGYRDCGDKFYRFVGNNHYNIINPSEEILLYKHDIPASKKQKAVTHYFFSTTPGDGVKDLTLLNLKASFPDNHKFHDLLDAEFKTDDELASYDSFHKIYKINRLLVNSR